jgi:zinc protease
MQLQNLRLIGLLFVLTISLNAFSQFKLDQPLPTDPNVKIGKLANGMTYYIHKNSIPEKKLELRLAVNAGSVLENNDQRGLAHFMEHMGFNGSKNFPKNELVNYLQKVGVKFGADLNAYTSFDETVYILPIPSDDPDVVEKGFTVLEDWAFNNLMDKDEIEKERGVVLEESRLSKGAGQRMSRQYYPRLFNGSIYADRLPIGQDSILKSFKPETLQSFYKQWYRPNLMAIIVVGDIDPSVAEQKIKAHFSKFSNPANMKSRPSIIPIKGRTSPEAMVVTDEEATSTAIDIFNFIRPRKEIKTWGDYRTQVVENLLTTLINQRLQELTQKENPPFRYAYTGLSSFLRGYETFESYAVLGTAPAQQAINALIAETERARLFGFLPAELERAKKVLLTQAEIAYNERTKLESGNLVWSYVNNFLQKTPIPGPENRYKFLKQIAPGITVAEINRLAKQMPASTNAFALITAPASMKDKLPTNELLLKDIVAATKQTVTPYQEKAVASKLLDKEPVPGKIVSETKNEKLGTTDWELSNGITVTLKPTNFKNDEILMDAWRWGGYHKFDLADKENARQAAIIVEQMGVKDLSPIDLRKFLSGKALYVHPYINNHEDGVEGSCTVTDFETFLQLSYLYFTQPRKDAGLFNSYITKQKSSVQFIRQNPGLFYQDTLNKIIYNNNPWQSNIPSESDYEQVSLDKSFGIYKQLFDNAYGMHFTFVGNLDPKTVKPLLEKYLGSLPAEKKENTFKDNNIRPVKGIVDAPIKKGKDPKSTITLVFTGETKYSPEDDIAFRAMVEVLNFKVIEKLREEMGGIYGGGFSGGIATRPYGNYILRASIPCGPENVEKLTNGLMDIIKTAQQNIEQKDLDKVKENWKKQNAVNLQSNSFWLRTLSYGWIERRDPEEILLFEDRVQKLTTADLQKAAQKYLDLNNYVKVVLYPENASVASDQPTPKPF